MLVQMVWMLTIGCVAVEGFFAWYVPQWRKFTASHGDFGKICDLMFSFFLSWILGVIFAAPSGLVIFMSAILSTIISMPMYPLLDWCDENRDQIKIHYDKARQIFIDISVLVYKILRLITIPIRMMRWSHQQYQVIKVSLTEAKSSLK